jgi:hypothetical protein
MSATKTMLRGLGLPQPRLRRERCGERQGGGCTDQRHRPESSTVLRTGRKAHSVPRLERSADFAFSNGVVDMTRPLCPYPQVAVYKGAGSTKDAANFSCKAP